MAYVQTCRTWNVRERVRHQDQAIWTVVFFVLCLLGAKMCVMELAHPPAGKQKRE